VRTTLHKEIERAFAVAETLGGKVDLRIELGLPSVRNDEAVVANMHQVVKDLVGEEKLYPKTPGMGAEDFSYLADLAPGAMFHLGAQIGDEIRRGHSETYDIDESAIPVGVAVLAESTRRYLTGEFSIT
jgi:metal-dependent amidase/aminoacylase/carboxypeptidase family protein